MGELTDIEKGKEEHGISGIATEKRQLVGRKRRVITGHRRKEDTRKETSKEKKRQK